jgi:hypothetical protein
VWWRKDGLNVIAKNIVKPFQIIQGLGSTKSFDLPTLPHDVRSVGNSTISRRKWFLFFLKDVHELVMRLAEDIEVVGQQDRLQDDRSANTEDVMSLPAANMPTQGQLGILCANHRPQKWYSDEGLWVWQQTGHDGVVGSRNVKEAPAW